MLPTPKVLSYDDLRELAAEFLDEYWSDRAVPVDIEWYAFQDSLPEEARSWYEWQANSFAGLILVPPDPLVEKLQDARKLAVDAGMEVDLEDDRTRSYLTEWIGRRFEVSAEVIERRGKYDGHWERF